MQNRIIFLKNVSDQQRGDVLDFIKLWHNTSKTIVLYTSGSTGKPKKVEILKAVMKASAMATGQYFGFQKSQKNLLALSADYIAGKMQIVRSIVFEMDLIIAPVSHNPLELIGDLDIDFAAFVPLQVQVILADGKTKSKYEAIPNVIIGGAAINTELFSSLSRLTNSNYATFGMTETVSHIALKKIRAGDTCYEALPNVNFKIDENQCLIINAPHISDKPLYTNDRVELKDDFTFIWLGRADFVINSGGVKIQPEIVEAKISSLIAKPFYISKQHDDLLGEKVVLCIESETETARETEKLMSEISRVVSKYEKPKSIIYKSTFLRTGTDKIVRE